MTALLAALPRTLRTLGPGLVLGLGCAALLLWPHWWSPAAALIGHPSLDAWSHAWGASWFAQTLAGGELPWVVDGAAFPERRVLWYIDPLGALLSLPAQLLFGPVVGLNSQLFLQVALAGLGGFVWGRSLGGRGFVAGAALATTPLLQGELWNGVSEACWLGPVALAGAAAARRSRWAGLWVGLAGVATPYHGLSAAALVGTLTLMGGADRRGDGRDRLLRLLLAAALCLLVLSPHLLALQAAMTSPDSFVNRPLHWGGHNPAVLRSNATDPWALVHPGDFWSRPFEGDEWSVAWRRTPYLGLGLLALSALSLLRKPSGWPLLLPVIGGAVACLGPFLWLDGDWARSPAGGYYRLPLAWVLEHAPVSLDHPMRFAVLAVVALAGLADRAVGRLGLLLAPLIVAEHLLLAPASWPVATSPGELPAVSQDLPSKGVIIDLPADAGTGNRTNAYLLWQRLHGHPIPYGNKVSAMGLPSRNAALKSWALLSRRGGGYVEGYDPDADLDVAVAELSEQGFRFVILHPDLLQDPRDKAIHIDAISALLGPPDRVGGAYRWEIPAP